MGHHIDVICLGEALIDFVSLQSGVSLLEAQEFRKAAGGAPANVAVGLARLGVRAAFLGKVGDEPFGQFLKQTLDENGVDTAGLVLASGQRTGLAFVSLTASGERDFVFFRHPSADMNHQPSEVPAHLFTGAGVFHYGSITLIQEPARSATLHALELARRAHLLISYDPNLRLNLWLSEEAARQGLREGLSFANVVKVSEEELAFITGVPEAYRAAAQILAGGAELVAVTRGARGCRYYTAAATGEVPGFPVQTVDTTGAGDGFVAGMLAGLLADWREGRRPSALDDRRLREVFRHANAVGALTTTVRGAIPALPSAEHVDKFLAGLR
ncbi:MAG: PfkB family carbohydrate kinase [Armatimonadota bacterium]|nr:PfkB family carbohydrate kinase [Armatimonadota bacterium]